MGTGSTTERGGQSTAAVITVPEVTRTSTIVVAASNSLDPTLAPAAYRCSGVNDEVEMNAALVAAAAVNGRVELLEGDYNTVGTLSVAVNVALVGNGFGTIINFNAGGNAVTVAGDNVKLRDFKVVITAGAGAGGTRPNCVYAANRTNLEITKVWLIGDETVADDGNDLRQCGLVFDTVTYSKVSRCRSDDHMRHGISFDHSDNNAVTGNTCSGNTRHGIYLDSSDNNAVTGNICNGNSIGIFIYSGYDNAVSGNACSGNGAEGIACTNDSHYNTLTGNNCNGNTGNGIQIRGLENTVTGNTCHSNSAGGIALVSVSDRNTITGNSCTRNTLSGIILNNNHLNTVTGNTCSLNTRNGIRNERGNNNTISGNACNWNVRNGIFVDRASNNTVTGNTCNENDSGNTGTYDGICIEDDSDYNIVHSNTCNDNDRWGISIGIAADDCVGNWVKNNHLRGNTSGPFSDQGTDTKLATLQADFVHATTATWVDPVVNTSPGGIDVDADGEIAMCHIKLPLELQLVVRIQIWAYSNVVEAANNMLLQVNVHGAGSGETWNTNAIDVVNHPSEETGGIAANDVIHWIIDSGDDADVAALTACDKLEILAVGEGAAAPDIATDALFGVALIEYV